MIVQGLLLLILAVNLVFGSFSHLKETLVLQNLVILFGTYCIPFITINLLLPLIVKAGKTESISQELNSLKAKDDVIKALLTKQPRIMVDKQSSQILFGNKNADILITILTNPHCNPCKKMHNKLLNYLMDENCKFCIQYIFASFGEEFDISSQFLIAAYMSNPLNVTLRIYKDWYTIGLYDRFSFFKKHNFPIDEKCINEYNQHNDWSLNSKLKATPTVLVNGYKIPKQYIVDDIRFLATFDFSEL